MRHPLTTIVAFHWAMVFGILALLSTLGGDGGVVTILSALGVGYTEAAEHAPLLSTLLSFGFAVAGVLFSWAFVTSAFSGGIDDRETTDVLRFAFTGAVLLVTVVVLIGVAERVSGLMPVAAAMLAALLVSYLAVFAERWTAALSTAPGHEDFRAAARVMALGAAHSSMLARLSGRPGAQIGGNG